MELFSYKVPCFLKLYLITSKLVSASPNSYFHLLKSVILPGSVWVSLSVPTVGNRLWVKSQEDHRVYKLLLFSQGSQSCAACSPATKNNYFTLLFSCLVVCYGRLELVLNTWLFNIALVQNFSSVGPYGKYRLRLSGVYVAASSEIATWSNML